MGYVTGGFGKKNPVWQKIADQTWYLYIEVNPQAKTYPLNYNRKGEVDNILRRKATRGTEQAKTMAKAFTYNPAVEKVTVYSSKIARAKGTAERFVWTREKGWK